MREKYTEITAILEWFYIHKVVSDLKVHKNENFFGFDFEICTFS